MTALCALAFVIIVGSLAGLVVIGGSYRRSEGEEG